jgi:hypothetical protein
MIAPQLGKIGQFFLQTRLTLARFGPVASAGCLLVIGGLWAWLWGVPHLQIQKQEQLHALARAQQTLSTSDGAARFTAPSVAQESLSAFYDVLGETRYVEQQIKTLFAIAEKTGLILNLADYKFAEDKNGRFQTYQIVLPVKGSYGAIRQFCEQVLLAIPFASLDEMHFKRDGIASGTLEARLRLTLYLTDKRIAGWNKEGVAAQGVHP